MDRTIEQKCLDLEASLSFNFNELRRLNETIAEIKKAKEKRQLIRERISNSLAQYNKIREMM